MSRIDPLPKDAQGVVVRAVLREVRRRVGREPGPIAAVARHRTLLFSQMGFELGLERSTSVDLRLKELTALRTAMVVGCEFCCDIGSFLARASGATEDELRDLADHRSSPRFDERDRAALDLAEAMSQTPSTVDDALWSRLREHFDEHQLVELCSNIAWENFRARLNHAMGFGGEGYSEGAFCVRPDHAAQPAAGQSA